MRQIEKDIEQVTKLIKADKQKSDQSAMEERGEKARLVCKEIWLMKKEKMLMKDLMEKEKMMMELDMEEKKLVVEEKKNQMKLRFAQEMLSIDEKKERMSVRKGTC